MTTDGVRSEPLTYRQDDPHVSYFRDLLFPDRTDGALERQRRHAAEMRVITDERNERAMRGLRAGDVEYRVEPNRTDGTGGYFAPPVWLTNLFATAKRPGRVLADLIPARFDLPDGCSSVSLPILVTGTTAQPAVDNASSPDSEITDAAGSSTVATLLGGADVPLQAIEQSPTGASLDWALFTDLTEATDADLESQLLYGLGSASSQLVGVTNVSSIVGVTYTSGSPTGSGMWPYIGQGAAQLADGRQAPPQIVLMRFARWAWLNAAEDTAGRPFGLPSPWYFGSGPSTPDPVGGLYGLPAFTDEAISATLGAGSNQDELVILRSSDLILFEAPPVAVVLREPLSGTLGARVQLHQRVAAITNRYASGIATVGGTGFAVASGY